MTRALIADDEPHLREALTRALAEIWPELEIAASVGNGREALTHAQEGDIDVAFLDIKMPAPNGIEVAQALIGSDIRVVFVTAYDDFAVQAFDAAAVDYLLKPIDTARLQVTVDRLQSAAPAQSSQAQLNNLLGQLSAKLNSDPLAWLRVGYGDTTQLVQTNDVVYFKADHKYTNVVTEDGDYVIRTSIKRLEEQLDGNRFWRVHRSYIVNAERVESAKRDLRGRYVLKLRGRKETIRTSVSHAHLFRQM